jgi:hypothetical protein
MAQKQDKLWIYGVVPAGSDLKHLADRKDLPEVSVIELGGLGALVGPSPEEQDERLSQQALWHAQVLETAVRDATVLPIALGTVVEGGDDAVAEQLLKASHDELTRYLEALADHVQMTLRVSYDQEALLRDISESEPEVAELMTRTRDAGEIEGRADRVHLGELISAAVERHRAQDSELILSRLRPHATRVAQDELQEDFMVLNAPFLVPRDALDEFESAVEDLASECLGRMRFVLHGPMPAYSFLDAQELAWA